MIMPDHNTQLIDLLTVLVPRMREHGIVSCDVPLEEGQLKLELTPLQIVDVLHNVSTVESAARTVDALSPEMGIFSEAVVEEGLHITKGAILGFVDVGPLRLALDAPVSGTVLLCLVPVNSVVGYHQPVFRIQPD